MVLASNPELHLNPQSAAAPKVVPEPAPPSAATPAELKLLSVESTRDYAVGTVRVVMDVSEGRRLPVQIWYPAVESARAEAKAGRPVVDFEPPGAERDILRRLTDTAPASYVQRTMHAADAPAVVDAAEPFPLVVVSHCDGCTRYAYFETAERLASKGFVVAGPDHVNNTMYNVVNGNSVGLDMNDFLERRRQDIFTMTDILLNPSAVVVPSDLRGRIDVDRIGMLGHSFGAITTAYASTRDPRIKAIAILAMIVSAKDNLPYTGDRLAQQVMLEPLSKPALFVKASEDIMAAYGMTDLMQQNYAGYPAEAWMATLRDAGHYSVCNLCKLMPSYTNCSGSDFRATKFLEPFTYLDIDTATNLTAALVTTYFEQQLLGVSASTLEGIAAGAPGVLSIEHHVP
jgi:predicted dienelactone hydrolase